MDLNAQYQEVKEDVIAAVMEVLEGQNFILGRQVSECEEAIATYCQSQYGIGVSSGSDALLLCLMAEEIGLDDEVITTPYSFFATAGCISRVGARPVFVDIDPATFNIDPAQIEDKITSKTKAIIPVHLFGQMTDMTPIMTLADKYDLIVVEDAAQAIGAECQGKRAGSIGHYGCLSFFPSKNLGAAGDGGMIVTQDAKRSEKLRILRMHGSRPKYFHKFVGANCRLDTIHAAIVSAKLKYLDRWTGARANIAQHYVHCFNKTSLADCGVVLPQIGPDRHCFNQFVIRSLWRDELQKFLSDSSIATAVYYPRCLHEQECFADLGYKPQDFPVASQTAKDSLALPVYPELPLEDVERVVQKIDEFYKGLSD